MDGSGPPSTPLTSRRPRDFRVCYDDNASDRQPWGVAQIDFLYSIQTNFPSESLSLRQKDAILGSISAAIVESVHKYGCSSRQSRKRRRQSAVSSSASSSRRTEMLSISPGDGHEWLGECDGLQTINESFCNEIHGTVEIAFDVEDTPGSSSAVASDFKSVGEIVLSRIKDDMTNGNYLDNVRNDVFGVTVNNIKYIDSDYLDLVAQDAFVPLNSNSEYPEATFNLTLFSKIAIPIMVILSLLAMGLCWCAMVSCPTDVFFAKRRQNKDSHNQHAERGDRKNNRKSKNVSTGRNEKLDLKSRNESSRSYSLEAIRQDLSVAESTKYGHQKAARSSLSTNQVLPFLARSHARTQSRLHTLDSNPHPSDTETGSSGRSVEMRNNFEDHAPSRRTIDLTKPYGREKRFANEKRSFNPMNAIASLFGQRNSNDLVDRITACNNNCFGDEQEAPPPTMRNENSNKDTVLKYVIPTVERSNSLVDNESSTPPVSRKATPTAVRSPYAQMGTKKSAAYREYINDKMIQRSAELDPPDKSVPIPMEIGVKRTFTDSQGRIREMVAL